MSSITRRSAGIWRFVSRCSSSNVSTVAEPGTFVAATGRITRCNVDAPGDQ
jgi:hypothetical protein